MQQIQPEPIFPGLLQGELYIIFRSCVAGQLLTFWLESH
jgi:hypothetical protein